MFQLQALLVAFTASLLTVALVSPHEAKRGLFPRQQQQRLLDNTSVLPPGWSGSPECFADCGPDPLSQFLLGPALVNSTGMTIELCVAFCDRQNMRMAGLLGDQCRCANIYNPFTCFESDPGGCEPFGQPCAGNPVESCGSVNTAPDLLNIFFKDLDLCSSLWQGGAKFTSGPWRLAWFYNDTVGARALPHNAVDLHPPLKSGNLTIEACVNACSTAGFLLAGVEFADECYCGNELENNSQPIPACGLEPPNISAMPCKGDPDELCGGPSLLYIYTLPGSSLSPLIPFDSLFDGFGGDGSEFGSHT